MIHLDGEYIDNEFDLCDIDWYSDDKYSGEAAYAAIGEYLNSDKFDGDAAAYGF